MFCPKKKIEKTGISVRKCMKFEFSIEAKMVLNETYGWGEYSLEAAFIRLYFCTSAKSLFMR
jgi:hypothetical protein